MYTTTNPDHHTHSLMPTHNLMPSHDPMALVLSMKVRSALWTMLRTDCEREDVKNGLVIKQQEECYQVSSNLSTWPSRLNQNDITLIMK